MTIAHSDKGEYPGWIDISAMVADPLTKVMDAEVLENEKRSRHDAAPRELGDKAKSRL